MKKYSNPGNYVYTMNAVYQRLKRGDKSVQIFWPGTGQLVKVTNSSYKRLRKKFSELGY